MKSKVSTNFQRSEFACSCGCGFDAVDIELLEAMQSIRDYFKSPMNVHCVCRCLDKNRSVGSKDTSKHLRGLAVDFSFKDIPHKTVYDTICEMYPDTYGIILYDWGVHLDIRTQKYRKDDTTK